MPRKISISLQIESDRLRDQFEEIVTSRSELLALEPPSSSSNILIMELDEADPSRTFGQITTLRKAAPRMEIFLTGARTDTSILLESLKAGVKEFLLQPVTEEEVQQALERFRARYEDKLHAEEPRSGTIVSVMGGKPGVGTTTVAVNLAVGLRSIQKEKSVLLVDLDLQGADLPLFLDLKPAHGLSELVKDPSRLDSTLVASLVAAHPSGISVFPLGDGEAIQASWSADWVQPTLDLLASLFDYVVIDCGQAVTPATTQVLERSSSVLVVSTLTLPVVCRTKQLLDSLHNVPSIEEKIRVVVNQHHQTAHAPIRETQDILQCKSLWFIPHDCEGITQAINHGQPLAFYAPRAPITKSYADLSAAFLGEQKKDNRRSGLGWYLQAFRDKLAPRRAATRTDALSEPDAFDRSGPSAAPRPNGQGVET